MRRGRRAGLRERGAWPSSASQIVFENGDLRTYGFDGSATLSASQGILVGWIGLDELRGGEPGAGSPRSWGDRGTGPAPMPLCQKPDLGDDRRGLAIAPRNVRAARSPAPDGTPGSTLVIDGQTVGVSGATLRGRRPDSSRSTRATVFRSPTAPCWKMPRRIPRTYGDSSDPVTEERAGRASGDHHAGRQYRCQQRSPSFPSMAVRGRPAR